MPAFTPRLNLYKPGGGSSGVIPDEVVDIDKLNDNADDIDAAIGAPNYTSGTRPPTPFTGQLINETDTRLLKQWDGSAWRTVGGAAIGDMYTGLALTTESLDAVLAPGSYVQDDAANATLARKYPFEGARGVLTVEVGVSSYRQTLHYWLNDANTAIYERVKLTTNPWTPWRVVQPFAAMLPSSVTGGTFNHRGMVTVSAQTQVFINGVFDASFEQYEILYELVTSAASSINMQMALAGVAANTAVYDNQRTTALGTTLATVQVTDVVEFQVSPISQIVKHHGRIVLDRPGIADNTTYHAITHSMPTTPGVTHGHSITTGQHILSTAYDGIRIYPASGNITGRISVKGIG